MLLPIGKPPARFETAALATVAIGTIVVGLLLDQHWRHGQWVVSLWTWALLAVLLAKTPATHRVELVACLLIAGTGEVICALFWGAYEYRLGNVPLFVPPGHVLLFWLGTRVVLALSQSQQRLLVRLTIASSVALGAALGAFDVDRLSLALVVILLVCIAKGREPVLYTVMFWLALVMELYGTALGNWHWAATTPLIGLSAANPPFAAGVFYAVLDLLVGAVGRAWRKFRPPAAQPTPPTSVLSV